MFSDAVERSKVTSAVDASKTQKQHFSSSLSLSSISSVMSKPDKRKGLEFYVFDD